MAKKQMIDSSLDDIINEAYQDSNTENNNDHISETTDTTSDLQEVVRQAVPVKAEVLTTHTSEMKEVRNDFATIMANKLNNAKDKSLKKYYAKTFKVVHDYLYYQGGYPKEDSKGKGEKLAELLGMIVPWLQYLGEWDVVNKFLLENGISIQTAIPLENREGFEFLKDTAMKNSIKGFFSESKDIQERICEGNDSITKDYYDSIPDDIKYDKHTNPAGLKPAQFNKLINIAAKMEIDSDKKDEIQNKAVQQLECLTESTNLLKDSILES